MDIFYGLLIPFLGTTLGAGCVFLMKKEMSLKTRKLFLGFASGVMVAACFWSLLLPALNQSSNLGKYACVPVAIGVSLGFACLFLIDILTPHLHIDTNKPDGPASKLKKTTLLCLAVTIHNIPEGMAVGVVLAGLYCNTNIDTASAFALSLGIAIQNIPEGAIISMPLASEGNGKTKSFIYGVLSGIVQPIAGYITILLTKVVVPMMSSLLSFAAGAMLFVVVEELIPESAQGSHSNNGTLGFATGFVLMMVLDNLLA